MNLAVDAHGLISSLHLQPAGPPPTTTTLAPLPEPVVPGIRQVPVGVGSPPLKGTLTLPAGKGPFPAVVLVSGSGPNNQDESDGPNHPFLDIAARPGRPGDRQPPLRQAHPRLPDEHQPGDLHPDPGVRARRAGGDPAA